MYKLILLDADRTIFDFDKAEVYSVKQAFSSYNISGDLEKMVNRYKVINMKLWKLYEIGEMDKKKIPAERFRQLFKEYELNIDPVEFGQEYLRNLSNSGFIIDGALELCQYLYSKYKVVILTNGIKYVQDSRLEHSSLKAFIHDMVVSDEVGTPKPNPEIFEFTLNKVGQYAKEDILMIGDSLTSDIQGGINFHIDTCWYNSDKTPSIVGINPTYTITKLEELYKLL